MKISVKGRYALAATISMAEHYSSGDCITVVSLSDRLGISKIYLEQVFSLLKRGGLVNSIKGAQGGYQLARMPQQITVYEILSAVELSLFEATETTVQTKAPAIEAAMQSAAFQKLGAAVQDTLGQVTLADLLTAVEQHPSDSQMMFYI